MIDQILEHFDKEYPREGCGLIALVKGKKVWFPCKNLAEDEEDFIMCSKDYLRIKVKYDIIGIVHNHPDASNEPSKRDIDNCNALGIPYYIFSYPEMELNIVDPVQKQYPLIGREYKFGVYDCFEAIRDYLATKEILLPPRAPFEDDWWKKEGLNYFCPDVVKGWGGKEITEPQENDVLIFTMDSKVPNHCGVYIGRDTFFHHAVNRLSCRESLYPFWIKYLTGVYRYDANSLS
jgi:proteasome lid subunit RPN8/RPN11